MGRWCVCGFGWGGKDQRTSDREEGGGSIRKNGDLPNEKAREGRWGRDGAEIGREGGSFENEEVVVRDIERIGEANDHHRLLVCVCMCAYTKKVHV